MSDPVEEIARITGLRNQMRYQLEELDLLWRQVIRSAVSIGQPASEIAEAAGISKARVYQIRDGRR